MERASHRAPIQLRLAETLRQLAMMQGSAWEREASHHLEGCVRTVRDILDVMSEADASHRIFAAMVAGELAEILVGASRTRFIEKLESLLADSSTNDCGYQESQAEPVVRVSAAAAGALVRFKYAADPVAVMDKARRQGLRVADHSIAR
jgi:hypothetical protein